MVLFGQVVIGPPGSGKTTYCLGMKMFLNELNRKCDIINLDYSNDLLPYECSIDVRDLISLQDTMEEHQLGPNGGLLYCMEYLLNNIEWLEEKITDLKSHYIIFDCPGQVELYTHHSSFQQILNHLTQHMNAKLCSVQLIDSYYCTQPSTFISAVLLVTSSMLKLGLPNVNILTKIDLLASYGKLPFHLDFFTECMNLAPLLRYLHNPEISSSIDNNDLDSCNIDNNDLDSCNIDNNDLDSCRKDDFDTNRNTDNNNDDHHQSKLQKKFHKMTQSLCEVIDDYGLVSFIPMNIEDAVTVGKALSIIDNANGYSMAALEISEWNKNNNNLNDNENNNGTSKYDLFKIASKYLDSTTSYSLDIQEKYGINDII